MPIILLGLMAPTLLGATDIVVAMPGFSCGPEIEASKREFFAEYLSQRLTDKGGLSVVTPTQISAVLGAERQRQLLGCSENSTECMTELAGALGSEAIIIGNLAKIGDEFAVTLKVLEPKSSKVLASASGRVKREEGLLDFFGTAADQLHGELLRKLRAGEVSTSATVSSRLTPKVWVPGALGVASLVVSGVMFGLARGVQGQLVNPGSPLKSPAEAHAAAVAGNTDQLVSGVLLGVGIVAVGAAVVLFLLSDSSPHVSFLQEALRPLAWAEAR